MIWETISFWVCYWFQYKPQLQANLEEIQAFIASKDEPDPNAQYFTDEAIKETCTRAGVQYIPKKGSI